MLRSAIARQDRSGEIELGKARLRCGQSPAWLLAIPEAELWVAAYHGPETAEFALELPDGQVRIEELKAGTVVWDKGQVTIDAIGLRGEPEITGAHRASVIRRG